MFTNKTALTLICVFFVTACGGNGGKNVGTGVPGPDSPTPDTCKSIYSVWRDQFGFEIWDLRSFESSTINNDFHYTSGSNVVCGSNTNSPIMAIATLQLMPDYMPYQISIVIDWGRNIGLGPVGSCSEYHQPGNLPRESTVEIVTEGLCNEIEIRHPDQPPKRLY